MPNKSCLGRETTWKEEEKEAGLRLFPSTFRTAKETGGAGIDCTVLVQPPQRLHSHIEKSQITGHDGSRL